MTSGKDDEELFRQRGFGVKIGFGERPALIVIDMLKGFTDASMPLGANLDNEIAAQQPLLEVAHERGIPVIFSTVIYDDKDLRDAGLWAIKMKGTATLKAGHAGGRDRPAPRHAAVRQPLGEEIRLLLLRHRPGAAADEPAHRHADHRRLHHLGLRPRHRGRRGAERLSADGGARGGRRPLGGGARTKPVRPQRQIRRRGLARRDAAVPAYGRAQPA